MGGYRKGSGRSKHGYYNGIYCGSTYELCWVIYSLDHGIKFTRFPGCLQDNKIKYFPDFLLDDKKTIIETKGYESETRVNKKTQLAKKLGYNVVVLRKKDLQYAFEYVQKKFNTNRFHTLYSDYKPKYEYNCCNCNKLFTKDCSVKTTEKFCSRVCAGKYRKQKNYLLYERIIVKCSTRSLTKDVALEIYNDNTLSYRELAKKYNISASTVWLIKTKRTYRWIHSC